MSLARAEQQHVADNTMQTAAGVHCRHTDQSQDISSQCLPGHVVCWELKEQGARNSAALCVTLHIGSDANTGARYSMCSARRHAVAIAPVTCGRH
jgi:hypothetical protein